MDALPVVLVLLTLFVLARLVHLALDPRQRQVQPPARPRSGRRVAPTGAIPAQRRSGRALSPTH